MPCSRLRRSARMGEVRLAGWSVMAGRVRLAACWVFATWAPSSIPVSEKHAPLRLLARPAAVAAQCGEQLLQVLRFEPVDLCLALGVEFEPHLLARHADGFA
jgi:hypothetical protein